MFVKAMTIGLALCSLAGYANAADFEMKMMNKGTDGAMVFEPAFIAVQPGDTINFVPVDKGHNVETIAGMLPDGAEPLKSAMSKPYSVTLSTEGLYGIKCTPHFGMGMVGMIQVGAATNLDAARAVPQKGKAAKRFDAIFAQVVK